MFDSDFAKSEYIEKDNVVFHTWKKEAHFDDYRKPVEASLEMLREHKIWASKNKSKSKTGD